MPSLLGIDNSTRTGCAFWAVPDKLPLCWTWHLKKVPMQEDYGARTWDLMERLEGFIRLQAAAKAPVDAIAYESPFIPMAPMKPREGQNSFSTTAHTLRLQISLASTVETVATKHKIRCIEVSTQSAKKALIGFGRAPKDQANWNWKTEMRNAATRQGYAVADDNQADAIAVGKVAYEHLWGVEIL